MIEHWLEIETAVAPRFSNGQGRSGVRIDFQKAIRAFQISGVLNRSRASVGASHGRKPQGLIAGEAIVELVYWPWDDHKVGFFVEPSYSYNFGEGHEQTVGVTAGLHIGVD